MPIKYEFKKKEGDKMKRISFWGLMMVLTASILFAQNQNQKRLVSRDSQDEFFSICTAFIVDGMLEADLEKMAKQEKEISENVKGIKMRRFFQCKELSQIIWAITHWESEELHNSVAQHMMKIRRDDRFASILFGPDPYFEIFCHEYNEAKIGEFTDSLNYIIIGHGLIDQGSRDEFLNTHKERFSKIDTGRIPWLRVYFNKYNSSEFVFFMGFYDQSELEQNKKIGEFHLLEYLFTGITEPLGMAKLAGYNQFICVPLKFDNIN